MMPLIPYICNSCGFTCKKMLRRAPFPSTLICDKCDGSMTRSLRAPSQSSKITVDNGYQARAVEIEPNIVEINEEQSKKNLRED
jgi:hypothetical protein